MLKIVKANLAFYNHYHHHITHTQTPLYDYDHKTLLRVLVFIYHHQGVRAMLV